VVGEDLRERRLREGRGPDPVVDPAGQPRDHGRFQNPGPMGSG
jgi:hypothetical protein